MLNNRKLEHLNICLSKPVEYGTNGFEKYYFMHNALPEINKDEIDLSVRFLNKKLNYPIIISAITGGTKVSRKINRNLAIAAKEYGIGLGVGSQRIALEQPKLAETFRVRDIAGDILLLSNIGAVQLNNGYAIDECKKIVDMIDADAIVLHLNPLQESIQPKGNTNFKNLSSRIKEICQNMKIPVIAKEVGCGISGEVAKKLELAGVKAIDIAGCGGTSWSKIENYRNSRRIGNAFYKWGIPTAESLIGVRKSTNLKIIASGGLRSGVDMAKAISLGADLVSIALPLLKPAMKSSHAVKRLLQRYIEELKISMFCVGAKDIQDLKKISLHRNND